MKTAIPDYVIPAFNAEHAGRLLVFESTMITELVAIGVALQHLRTLDHPSPAVLLTCPLTTI